MFEEFMELHGAKNATEILNRLRTAADEPKNDEKKEDEDENEVEDSGHESSEENEEKIANKKISDFEVKMIFFKYFYHSNIFIFQYMKLLMKGKSESKPRQKMEKKPKEKIQLYTLKVNKIKNITNSFFNTIIFYSYVDCLILVKRKILNNSSIRSFRTRSVSLQK